MAFLRPDKWTESDFQDASAKAAAAFAESRKTEGLDFYISAYEKAVAAVDSFLDETDQLRSLSDGIEGSLLFGALREVRYLTAPPISNDDLKNLAEVRSLSKSCLAAPENAARVIDIVRMNLDPVRFPWFGARRLPTSEERAVAVISTASLIASQETQTNRRSLARENQENAVAYYLESLDYREVPRRSIALSGDAPGPGEFCRESKVGGKKADMVIGMADGRFMALECKVSNSEVNSFKRLNHETVEKVQHWSSSFGSNGVVGAAVLAGVFKVSNLVDAQDDGVSIFWSFDLTPLGDFLEALG